MRYIIRRDYVQNERTITGDYYASVLDRLYEDLKNRPHFAMLNVHFHDFKERVHKCLVPLVTFNELCYDLLFHSIHSLD